MNASTRRVCIVTGSSSGIGAATARLFARNGFDIVVNYSRNPAPAEVVSEQCRALGAQVLTIQANIADDAQCRELAAQVQDRWGRADVLVNNAGTTKFVAAADLDGLSATDFQDIYAVNVIGAWQMTRACVPLLRQGERPGVVNVSSIASMMGRGSSIAYMASKGALNAMTFGLAKALGPTIRVNAVAPGFIESPWLRQGLGEANYAKARQTYCEKSVLGDVMTPEDIAEAIWWLGAGAAKTTGEVMLVDAGLGLGRS